MKYSLLLFLFLSSTLYGHFGMVIPSKSIVEKKQSVSLNLSFSHPFEMIGMPLVRPKKVGVLHKGKKTDLLKSITKTQVMNHDSWKVDYNIRKPGVYTFYMEPEAYWEPTEDSYIIHYTKTLLSAFGDEDGWDQEVGLVTEIVPLTRPFGLYAHNTFSGVVKAYGKPIPFAEVEVELYNQKKFKQPTSSHITQVVKADQNGVFHYSVPTSGWWGFAALTKAKERIKYKNRPKDVEIGAVLWAYFNPWN